MTHAGLVNSIKGLWNHASFCYWKLFLLLLHVGDEEALISIVFKICIWRLVKGRVELNIYHHSFYLAVLEWSTVQRFPLLPLILLLTVYLFSPAHHLYVYILHIIIIFFPTTFVVQLSSGLYWGMEIIDPCCVLGKGQRIESYQQTRSAWLLALWFLHWPLERAADCHNEDYKVGQVLTKGRRGIT